MRHVTLIWSTLLSSVLIVTLLMTLALFFFWPRVLGQWHLPSAALPAATTPRPSMPIAPAAVTAVPRPPIAVPSANDEEDPVEEEWNNPAAQDDEPEMEDTYDTYTDNGDDE